jgi:hypothetical protein
VGFPAGTTVENVRVGIAIEPRGIAGVAWPSRRRWFSVTNQTISRAGRLGTDRTALRSAIEGYVGIGTLQSRFSVVE